jgi:glutamine phosphoribosylpyrophosphate amidotransferase
VRTFDLPAAIEFIRENTFSELIGHCRYDTSGDWKIINNNQPIVLGQSLLAFNGVVRMSTREEYQQEFQREYTTENDGEIILRMLVEEDRRLMSLLEQKRVTFAGVAHVNNKAMALRNERRPLWRALSMDVEFVFSTYDIWSRAIQSTEFYYLSALDIPPMEPVWL